jgi:hypothetical protein
MYSTRQISRKSDLEDVIIDGYDSGKIKDYKPSREDGMNTNQRSFLIKLKQILINNDPDSESPNCEKFIDDLMMFLCERANLDDGLELTIHPCNLKLYISDQIFPASADKEGRKGTELAWLIQGDKHRRSTAYKHGDLQLACSMIAAFQ